MGVRDRSSPGDEFLGGGGGSDTLLGAGGADILNGGGGPAEIDRVSGGEGADVVVLGSVGRRFYDDGTPGSPGHDGYAVIDDFRPSQGDRLELFGPAGEYLLGTSPFASPAGPALYHDSNTNGVIDPAADELIAVWSGGEPVTAANTLGAATTAQAPDFAAIGLSPVSVSAVAGRIQLDFLMTEDLPASVVLELHASASLAAPWETVAVLYRNGSWSGVVDASVSPAADGKVQVHLTPLDSDTVKSRRFFRFALKDPADA